MEVPDLLQLLGYVNPAGLRHWPCKQPFTEFRIDFSLQATLVTHLILNR